MLDQDIWAYNNRQAMDPWDKEQANSIVVVHTPIHPSRSGKNHHPDVNLADLPVLECPPLSPATLHLLGTFLQTSPSFDSPLPTPAHQTLPSPSHTTQPSNPSSISLAPVGPSDLQHSTCSTLHPDSCSLNPHSPSVWDASALRYFLLIRLGLHSIALRTRAASYSRNTPSAGTQKSRKKVGSYRPSTLIST